MTAATMRRRCRSLNEALFERALAERQKRGPNRETRIARWCVARCLRSLGRLEEALAQQHELLAEEVAAGEAAGFTWEEIGECLLALGREVEARPALRAGLTRRSRRMPGWSLRRGSGPGRG